MRDPLASCLAIYPVTASMVIDGDTIRGPNNRPDARLTGEGNIPHDTPETFRPSCEKEAELGALAERVLRDLLRDNGGGVLCIIDYKGGSSGRDLGVLYVDTGAGSIDAMSILYDKGLAKRSTNADWCD